MRRFAMQIFTGIAFAACASAWAAEPPAPVDASNAAVSPAVAPASPPAPPAAAPAPTAAPAPPAAPASAVDGPFPGVTTAQDKAMRSRGYKPETRGGVTVYCRKELPVGSRFPTKTCASAADVEQSTEASKDLMRDIQQRGNFTPPKG